MQITIFSYHIKGTEVYIFVFTLFTYMSSIKDFKQGSLFLV